MSDVVTQNMALTVPGVNTSPGPAYASLINTDLGLIDVHDHSTGKGVPITPSGLNINGDLPFNGNNATTLRSVRFTAQGSPITGSSTADVGCVYVAGVDLYFNDVNGVQVRLTSGGGVAGSPGSITNLTAPATATYVSASQKFVWQSDANIAADLDFRSAIFRNSGASSFGLTLQAPTLGADTTQTLPAVPGATAFVSMDATGAMATNISTVNGITRSMLAAVGQQISDSCGAAFSTSSTTYGNLGSMTVTLTTTGRPVMLMCIPDGSGSPGCVGQSNLFSALLTGGSFAFFRDASAVSEHNFLTTGSGSGENSTKMPPGILNYLDTPAAGTYVYTLRAKTSAGPNPMFIERIKIVAFEL